MTKVFSKAQENLTVVVTIGGSMTAGANAATPWPARFEQWLRRAYPASGIKVENWAQGSSGSGVALTSVVPRLASLGARGVCGTMKATSLRWVNSLTLYRICLWICNRVGMRGRGRRGPGAARASRPR